MQSIGAIYGWVLLASAAFAIFAGIRFLIGIKKAKRANAALTEQLEAAHKQIKSLEKAAESIRRELLETQQYQDINQLKLKSTKSSAEELRQALLDARKRLKIAEAALNAHETRAAEVPATPKADFPLPAQKQSIAENEAEILEQESAAYGVTLDVDLEFEGGLSQHQREQLIDLLDPGPKGNLDIFCVMGDEGSELTARQIEEILAADGWKTGGVSKSAFATPPKGISLVVNSKETAPSYASFLQRVLSTIGLTVSAKIDKKYREWSLSVIVGSIDA